MSHSQVLLIYALAILLTTAVLTVEQQLPQSQDEIPFLLRSQSRVRGSRVRGSRSRSYSQSSSGSSRNLSFCPMNDFRPVHLPFNEHHQRRRQQQPQQQSQPQQQRMITHQCTHARRILANPRRTSPHYCSQLGEDHYAFNKFFRNFIGGTFVELGALDGTMYSNTKFFETARGWSGVLIEANPKLFSKLCLDRACSHRINAAICDPTSLNSTTLHFVNPKDGNMPVGGLWEFMSPSYRDAWYPNASTSPVPPPGIPQVVVQCYSLEQIFDFLGYTHIDFFSLDVEGAELSVLRTINFGKVEIDVIVVELDGHNPFRDQAATELLLKSGFVLHTKTYQDSWFVRANTTYATLPASEITPIYAVAVERKPGGKKSSKRQKK